MNIFEKLAQQNQENDFANISTVPQETTEEGNIFERLANKQKEKEENQFGFLDTLKDIGEQVISKGISGLGGTYANLLETFGLQNKEGELTPGEEAKYSQQFAVLEKMQRGEVPTYGEFMSLADEEFPYSRIPTSREIKSGIEALTGIGEGKTPIGRIAGRGAEFIGEGAATGGTGKVLGAVGLSGAAGQGIREAGGPELAATAVEIGGSLAPSLISQKLIPSGKSAKDLVEAGRKVGLSEAQITPLIQGEKKVATLSKIARKGSKTKELFSSIKEKLGDSYNTIKASKDAKVKLPNADQIKIRKDFSQIRNDLSKTLAPSPDKEAALNYIEKSLDTLRNANITPEYLINFWQDINRSVKWNSINGGKKALAKLKEPISDILNKAAPNLAKDFEMTNELYTKYSQISKKLKPDIVEAFLNKGEIIAAPAAGIALVQGNPWALAGLASESALRLLGREMLINPYFQDLGKKLVKNFNQGSIKSVTESIKQAQEYMSRKHPNEDWSFLTKSHED